MERKVGAGSNEQTGSSAEAAVIFAAAQLAEQQSALSGRTLEILDADFPILGSGHDAGSTQ